jgi:hypothetical protein
MRRQAVNSSNVASVGYDENSKVLEVAFKSGGVYQYSNVPRGIYEGMISATSVGSYFHKMVKEKFAFTKVS